MELSLPEPGLRPGWLGGIRHNSAYPAQLIRINTDKNITGIALSECTTLSALAHAREIGF